MLKSTFILALGAVLFSSCATILNSRRELVTIKKDSAIKNFTVENKEAVKISEEQYYVLRKKNQPLLIKGFLYNGDSAKANVYPRISLAYFGNFLLYSPAMLVGVLVDANKDKKFGYPPKIFLSKTPSGFRADNFNPNKKGLLQANFGFTILPLPNLSTFHRSTGGKALSFINFLGLGAGLNYYYQNNQYIGLATEASVGFGIRDKGTTRSSSTIWFWNLKNNLVKNRWEWGYGLGYARAGWWLQTGHGAARAEVASDTYNLLGLSGSVTYKISHPFGVQFQLQPYFYSFGGQRSYATFQYFAGISLQFYLDLLHKK